VQYAEYAKSQGLESRLACNTLWPGQALICFKVLDGKKLRWVTTDDLAKWRVSQTQLREVIQERALTHLESGPKPMTVDGMPGGYFLAAEGDGWSAAGVLLPGPLSLKLGMPVFLAAVPSEGVALFWKLGDAELDKVLAIGVTEMYESEDGPVSPVIYQWDGLKWQPFIEAKEQRREPGKPL